MRILVAGGTGVLGREAVPQLVAAGHDVAAVSRRAESDDVLRDAGAVPLRLDIFDGDAVRSAAQGMDAVVNIATRIPPYSAAARRAAWAENDRLRRNASRIFADAAIAAGARFVQESFAPAYRERASDWITEDAPLDAVEQTGTVRDAEASAAAVTAAGGVGVVLRFGLFYGPGSRQTRDMLAAARKGLFMLPGPGHHYSSMIYVPDAAAAVVAALEVPAGHYNVVEDEPLTREEHAAVLAELVGRERVRVAPAMMGKVWVLRALARSHRVSNGKLRSVSQWRPVAPSVRQGWKLVMEELGRVG